jgi:hypothetical protein
MFGILLKYQIVSETTARISSSNQLNVFLLSPFYISSCKTASQSALQIPCLKPQKKKQYRSTIQAVHGVHACQTDR